MTAAYQRCSEYVDGRRSVAGHRCHYRARLWMEVTRAAPGEPPTRTARPVCAIHAKMYTAMRPVWPILTAYPDRDRPR